MLMRSRTLVATGALLALALLGGCAKDSEPPPLRLETLAEENRQLREQVVTLGQEVRRLRRRADDTDGQVAQLVGTLAKAQEDLRSRLGKLASEELAGRRRSSGHAIRIKTHPPGVKGTTAIIGEPWVGGGPIIINGVDAPVTTGTVIIKPDALRIEKLPKKPKPK